MHQVQQLGQVQVQDVGLVVGSLTAINVVFREVWNSVQEEGRVPLQEVDGHPSV